MILNHKIDNLRKLLDTFCLHSAYVIYNTISKRFIF